MAITRVTRKHVLSAQTDAKLVTKINSGRKRNEQIVWFCELPDSPTSSCYPPSTDECDEYDVDDDASVDQTHQLQDDGESDEHHEAQTVRLSAGTGTLSRWRHPYQLRKSQKKQLRHRKRRQKKKKTQSKDGAVPHPTPALGVNGDGTSDALGTSPFLNVSFPLISCEMLVRFHRPRKQATLDGSAEHPHETYSEVSEFFRQLGTLEH